MLPNVWLRTPPSFLFPFLEGSAKRSQLPVSGTKSQFYSPRVLQSYRVLYRPVVGIGICIRIRAPFVATTVERTLEIVLLTGAEVERVALYRVGEWFSGWFSGWLQWVGGSVVGWLYRTGLVVL